MSKPGLRRRLREARRRLPDRGARSARIAAHLVASAPWRAADVIGLYATLRDEVDTSPLLATALSEGRRLALPRVAAPDAPLVFHEVADPRALVKGAFGVREPAPDLPVVPLHVIGLVCVPAVAVDAHGTRLGYGGGFYDRTLPGLTSAVRIALAFDTQLVDDLPREPFDVPMHGVVTESGLRAFLPDDQG